MTSQEVDNYDHTHSAEMDSTTNNAEATADIPQPADRTPTTDNPLLNSETAVIQRHGDVQQRNGAVLAAPLAASGNINNPQRWQTLLGRTLHEWLNEGNIPPSRNPWGDDR